jgi:hypothetical protein
MRPDLDSKSTEELHRNYYVCANHFKESQFLNGLKNRLKWNAIPTLFNVCMFLIQVKCDLAYYIIAKVSFLSTEAVRINHCAASTSSL